VGVGVSAAELSPDNTIQIQVVVGVLNYMSGFVNSFILFIFTHSFPIVTATE
jgi:hypothetical protein